MSKFVPRAWIATKAISTVPDKTDKSTSVCSGGASPLVTTAKAPSVGFVSSYPGANEGKYECEVCLDGIWARRWLSSVEVFNRCCGYLKSVRGILGTKANHASLDTTLMKVQPNDQSRELIQWLGSLTPNEVDLKWTLWDQQWREYVSGWADPNEVTSFGIIAHAGKFAGEAGVVRWDSYTPAMAVSDYLEVISNHRWLTGF